MNLKNLLYEFKNKFWNIFNLAPFQRSILLRIIKTIFQKQISILNVFNLRASATLPKSNLVYTGFFPTCNFSKK